MSLDPLWYFSMTDMEFVRRLSDEVASLRKTNAIPESYPLVSLDFYKGDEHLDLLFLDQYSKLICDSCNVSEFSWDLAIPYYFDQYGVSRDVKLDFKKAGPALGPDVKVVGKALKDGTYTRSGDGLLVGDLYVPKELYSDRLVVPKQPVGRLVKVVDDSGFLVLNSSLDYGRRSYVVGRLVRSLNSLRKSEGLEVGEKVSFVVQATPENYNHYKNSMEELHGKTNAVSITLTEGDTETVGLA